MVAPLPQDQRAFKREFDQNRLAALRGDTLVFPDQEEEEAYQQLGGGLPAIVPRSFAPDSEDGILAQLTPPSVQAFPEETTPSPAEFAFNQQQARMNAGIGAPELLSPEAAALPDPEYSTDDDVITYGESIAALSARAREASSIDEVNGFSAQIQNKAKDAVDAMGKQLEEWAKEQANRWIAKGIGNGGNALDSVGWDGFIVFTITYIYILARGFVSALVPEPERDTDEATMYAVKKGLYILLPPYRPLREPGDFLWFLAAAFVAVSLLVLIVFALFMLTTITTLPAFLPGAVTSTL